MSNLKQYALIIANNDYQSEVDSRLVPFIRNISSNNDVLLLLVFVPFFDNPNTDKYDNTIKYYHFLSDLHIPFEVSYQEFKQIEQQLDSKALIIPLYTPEEDK